MKQNTPSATTDKRTCYVGAKVTPMQRETIRTLAARCGMTADRRRQLFNDHPYMLGWLNELRKLAKRITAVLDELCKPNPIPERTTNNISNNSDL